VAKDPFLTGRRISWAAAVVVGVAAVLTALVLRDGLPGGGTFTERMESVASGGLGQWAVYWIVRMLAAILVLAFLVTLSRTLTPGYPALRSVAVQIVAIGVAAELIAVATLAVVLPPLAARYGAGETEFLPVITAVEGAAVTLSAFLGTGLVSVGGALIAHAAGRTPPFPRSLAVASLCVWGPGFLVAGATLSASTRGLDIYTLLYLPVLALWIAAVAASHFRPPAGIR